MGASAIGGLIGPTLAGYLFDTTGSYTFTWIILGIATSSTVALMLGLGRQQNTRLKQLPRLFCYHRVMAISSTRSGCRTH